MDVRNVRIGTVLKWLKQYKNLRYLLLLQWFLATADIFYLVFSWCPSAAIFIGQHCMMSLLRMRSHSVIAAHLCWNLHYAMLAQLSVCSMKDCEQADRLILLQ